MSDGRLHDPVEVLNERHADDLLAVGRTFGRHPDATSVRAKRIDSNGIDLTLDTPEGPADVRVPFAVPLADTDRRRLRAAFANLATRARTALAGGANESSG